MFEDYIQDAFHFFHLGEENKSIDERVARRFYRASVFCAASAVEAFVNVVGESVKQAKIIDSTEMAFLNDEILEVNPSKASVEHRTRYFSVESKVKYLITRFNADFDISSDPAWQKFLRLKDFRDSLVHPKEQDDENSIEEYRKRIREGLNANLDIMNSVAERVFSRGLRKGIAELRL